MMCNWRMEQVDGAAVQSKHDIIARLNFLAHHRPDFDTSGKRPTATVFTFDEPDPDATVASTVRNDERVTPDHTASTYDDSKSQHELFPLLDSVAGTNPEALGGHNVGNNVGSQRQETSLLDPDASLPVGWASKQSRSTGATYYLNLLTAAQTYDRPTTPALPPWESHDTNGTTEIDPAGAKTHKADRKRGPRGAGAGDENRLALHAMDNDSSVNPLRTIQELVRRQQAATVLQSHWRGKIGRRAVDKAMSFALFRRFADQDEIVTGADGVNVVVGPALGHHKCNELLVLCGLDEAGRGVAQRCVANFLRRFIAMHVRFRGAPCDRDRPRVDADAFWSFSGLSKTEALGFETFMTALAHYQAVPGKS